MWNFVLIAMALALTPSSEVRRLGSSGAICHVYGHQWRDGRPGEGPLGDGSGIVLYFADNHPGISYRTCTICGKRESNTNTWK